MREVLRVQDSADRGTLQRVGVRGGRFPRCKSGPVDPTTDFVSSRWLSSTWGLSRGISVRLPAFSVPVPTKCMSVCVLLAVRSCFRFRRRRGDRDLDAPASARGLQTV